MYLLEYIEKLAIKKTARELFNNLMGHCGSVSYSIVFSLWL